MQATEMADDDDDVVVVATSFWYFLDDGDDEVRIALPVPEIINSDWSFGRRLRNRELEEEEAVGGRGWYRSQEPIP